MERVRTKPEPQQEKYIFKHPFNNIDVIIELIINYDEKSIEIDPIAPETIKDDGQFYFGQLISKAAINNIVCMLIEDATDFAVEKLK